MHALVGLEYGFRHSSPQSCDPFGQRHRSRALAGTEAGSPRIMDSRLSVQPQKFETITVTIVSKMGSYCACALSWPLPELSNRGAGQKDRSSGDENGFSINSLCHWIEPLFHDFSIDKRHTGVFPNEVVFRSGVAEFPV